MEGIINQIVGEGRPSVRGSWGSSVPPLTPVADPPATIGFDALPAPEAPMPATSDAERAPEKNKKKKKEAATPLAPPVDGTAWNKQVQPQEEGEKRTDETT